MSLDRSKGNENIADVISVEPSADIDQIREKLIDLIRWLGDREPVAPGSIFLKFATFGALVDLGLVTTQELLTNEDDPGDGEDPTAPEELYVEFMARDMRPSVTNGSSSEQVLETGPTYPNLHYIEFDPDTDTSCEISTILPAGWIGGTFQFRLYWSHPIGSVGAWDVKWELQVNTYSSGQALARVLVPGSVVQAEGGSVDTLYITNESDPVEIPGALNMPGNYVVIRIFRRGTDAADTLTVPARLHAVRFNLGNAPVDYPPPPSAAALLLHLNTDLTDSGTYARTFTGMTPSGTRTKFGSGALTFSGTNYITTPYYAPLAFVSGVFSIDLQLYIPSSTTLATDNCIAAVWGSVGQLSWYLGLSSIGRLRFFVSTDGTTFSMYDASPGALARDQWQHIAVWLRPDGTYFNAAIDGVVYAVAGQLAIHDAAQPLTIGAVASGAAAMPSGVSIDEFRICIGTIDYDNADFVPPTASYP
jgi:hypothetical protein